MLYLFIWCTFSLHFLVYTVLCILHLHSSSWYNFILIYTLSFWLVCCLSDTKDIQALRFLRAIIRFSKGCSMFIICLLCRNDKNKTCPISRKFWLLSLCFPKNIYFVHINLSVTPIHGWINSCYKLLKNEEMKKFLFGLYISTPR